MIYSVLWMTHEEKIFHIHQGFGMQKTLSQRLHLPLKMSNRRTVLVLLVCVGCLQLLVFSGLKTCAKCGEKISISTPNKARSLQKVELNPTEQVMNQGKVNIQPQGTDDEMVSHFKDALLFPAPRRKKGFLTIGIPTIKRQGAVYVLATISSLLVSMSPAEKEEVIIVVFLADREPDIKLKLAGEIQARFNDSIKTGMIHVIQAPDSYYPDFSQITKLTYGETEKHVRWRAKQCYDYAYMMEYSTNLSTYYMQLEDDVVTSYGFIQSIKDYMNKQKPFWVCLEFSELGFIGKLYRSSEIEQLGALLKLFYIEQPVDYTYTYFNMLMLQMSKLLRRPTLFQHKGIKSSLTGKIQNLKDRYYDIADRRVGADNPPARVFSSMRYFMTYFPELAYKRVTDGYFWSNGPPRVGSNLTVVFEEPQQLHRVVVETGTTLHPHDTLQHGVLIAGFSVVDGEDGQTCSDIDLVGKFVGGRIDANNLEYKFKRKAACLVIQVTERQGDWMIIRDIRVSVANTTLLSE